MAAITLRAVKGSPLTNTEIDNNFSNINTELGTATSDIDDINVELSSLNLDITGINSDISVIESTLPNKLDTASYTAADVRTKLLTVDGSGSGIDADLLDGQHGSYYAPVNNPTLTGNPLAPTRTTTDNSTSIATTAFVQANAALKVSKSGDTMTGSLVLSGNATNALHAVPLQQLQTPTVNSLNGGQLGGFRNKIINGKMNIAQQGTSFVAVPAGTITIDRWQSSGTNSASVTVSQSADVPAGGEFVRSLLNTFVTGDNAIAAGDSYSTQQNIEGYEVSDLIGKDFSISFWVKASVPGTYCVSLRNNGNDRSYIAEYTVLSSNTWEYKTITIAGGLITAGSWNWVNAIGLRVSFVQACGTTFQTTPNVWQTGIFFGTANQVNCLATNGNTFSITGVQIESGSRSTPFEHRHTTLETILCRRYMLVRKSATNLRPLGMVGFCASATLMRTGVLFDVEMRVAPTFSVSSPGHLAILNAVGTSVTSAVAQTDATQYAATVDFSLPGPTSALTTGHAATIVWSSASDSNSFMKWDAEL